MNESTLYEILQLPKEVADIFAGFEKNTCHKITAEIRALLKSRSTWDRGLEELKKAIGNDPDGLKLLWELLYVACDTYAGYAQMGISEGIFAETMKFVPRFLNHYYAMHNKYAFIWSWWFPRQLAMREYRVGCMEYEFVDEGDRFISLHIPSDADLSPESIDQSFAAFKKFVQKFYPDWVDVRWGCDSWLLSPVLNKFLKPGSNILAFQARFDVESVNWESMGVLDWVFPPHTAVSESLQEDTSLQRSMKAYLLDGGKIGWAKGWIR